MEKENNKENQNPINSNRRHLLSLAGAAGTAALLSPLISKAAPSTIIEAGSNVDTASYIIFQDSGKIYAKNGTTGKIEFQGSDASGVIQGAINALIKGGKIFIRNETYNITASIIISNDNINIIGEGFSTILYLANGSNVNIIYANGKNNFICKDLVIDGNRTNQGGALTWRGMAFYNTTNTTIDNVFVKNTSQMGIVIQNTPVGTLANTIVRNCRFTNNAGDSVYLSGKNVVVQGCEFYDLAENGIAIQGVTNGTVIGNTIDNVGGVVVGNQSENISVIGNVIRAGSGHSIRSYFTNGVYSAKNVIISNNIIIDAAQDGISVRDAGADKWNIMGNYISNTGTSGRYGDGIYIKTGTDHKISDNTIISAAGSGIIFDYTTSIDIHSLVTGNICKNCGRSGAATAGGIKIYQANYITISSNKIYDNQVIKTQKYGINEYVGNNNIFINNDLRNGGSVANLKTTGANSVVANNQGYITENNGTSSISDGSTIPHSLSSIPTKARLTGTVAGEIVTVTSLDATNIKVAIKKPDSSSGTPQTIYWEAEV